MCRKKPHKDNTGGGTRAPKSSPGTRELIATMAGLPRRRFISLERSEEAVPLLSPRSNPHKCVAVCRRLNVFWAVTKHACTVWQEKSH